MSRGPVRILQLAFDDENIEEMAAPGVTPRQVMQVLNNRPRVARNRKGRRAMYLLVGVDDGGACIAIPMEPTRDATTWRPVTAWYCKPHEWNWLPRR